MCEGLTPWFQGHGWGTAIWSAVAPLPFRIGLRLRMASNGTVWSTCSERRASAHPSYSPCAKRRAHSYMDAHLEAQAVHILSDGLEALAAHAGGPEPNIRQRSAIAINRACLARRRVLQLPELVGLHSASESPLVESAAGGEMSNAP